MKLQASRKVVDELRVDVDNDGAVLLEFERHVEDGDGADFFFRLKSDDAARLGEELLSWAGHTRARAAARRLLRWADDIDREKKAGNL